ncbi:MAG: hypothetical protein ACXV5F_07745, partial [Halobacteriota archaeon]
CPSEVEQAKKDFKYKLTSEVSMDSCPHVTALNELIGASVANAPRKAWSSRNAGKILDTECTNVQSMSLLTKESESIVSQYSAAFNIANLATFEEVFDRDVINHYPPPGQPPGLGAINQTFRMMNVASPDSPCYRRGHYHGEPPNRRAHDHSRHASGRVQRSRFNR